MCTQQLQFLEDLQKKAKMLTKFLELIRELIWKERMSRCINYCGRRGCKTAQRKHSMLYADEYVTLTDGTGVIAPAFGEDDAM